MKKRRDAQLQNILVLFLIIVSVFVLSFAVTSKPHRTSARANDIQQKTRYIDEVFPELDVHTNVGYSVQKGRDYLLDIYEPKGDTLEQRPAIIWIHGGGFVGGSKEVMIPYAEYFAKRGYVTVSINYRLGTQQPVLTRNSDMAQVINNPLIRNAETDAQTAIRWIRTNAQTYRINTDKIFVGGSSAGAVTALLVGYDYEFTPASEYPGIAQTVSGVVSIAGTTDPETMSANDPSIIMFHGERDTTVPFELAKKVKEKIDLLGIENEFYSYPEETHGLRDHKEEIMGKTALFFAKLVDGVDEGGPTATPQDVQPTTPIDNQNTNEAGNPEENRAMAFIEKHAQRICTMDKQRVVMILQLFQMKKADIEEAYDQVCGQK